MAATEDVAIDQEATGIEETDVVEMDGYRAEAAESPFGLENVYPQYTQPPILLPQRRALLFG